MDEWIEGNTPLYALGQDGVFARGLDKQVNILVVGDHSSLAGQPLFLDQGKSPLGLRLLRQSLQAPIYSDHTLAALPTSAAGTGYLDTQPQGVIHQGATLLDVYAISPPGVLGEYHAVLDSHLVFLSLFSKLVIAAPCQRR